MENRFILELRENRFQGGMKHARLARLFKWINRNNKTIQVAFKSSLLNELLGIIDQYAPSIEPSDWRRKQNLLRGGATSIEQAINMFHLLTQVVLLKIAGDVVELGCYEGTTAILLQKTLDGLGSSKKLHVFDSFEGLPNPSSEDGNRCHAGQFRTSIDLLASNFAAHKTKMPTICPGWFKDTLPKWLPARICFAHLDGDLYCSIMESLTHVYPRLSKGAIVVVDDYCDPQRLAIDNALPAVKKACDEFLADKPERMNILLAGACAHGYFRRQ